MTEQEARQILGIEEGAAWEEILKKYDVLFEKNAKNGSFYLQSKVHRAKECLEVVYREGVPIIAPNHLYQTHQEFHRVASTDAG
ncbi:hypothetical protein SAY86_017410 [Trapa natans]|uniref:Uncharacterized protein n=1 Tax=Trapa natans TaxID=22666 RepID=A0AAN7LP90_TRANT|nr:hypothetical protein SAY86_017410 [Trapa natans]